MFLHSIHLPTCNASMSRFLIAAILFFVKCTASILVNIKY